MFVRPHYKKQTKPKTEKKPAEEKARKTKTHGGQKEKEKEKD